ncbi:HNH endonuclease signature motif containing protein [Ferruginibacter sp. HRS2-29]|uniref:HNH endonuclease signature motif containing protein n=1 Tax=Ferruginibacter sp. HRS2-29 TaxID=2487334 RepID=UPI0020CBF20B
MKEIKCSYKDEVYSVRDDGSILRHPLLNRRPRPTDNKWTLGKLNIKTGYLEIASVRVHRIVATAFHGDPPSGEHVVDHIDTNKQNNRPENLRWVTRLENILLNPITARRIEIICGSVEAFLANPAQFRDKFHDPNFAWMCNVSAIEARLSYERLLAWCKSDKYPTGGALGLWLFNRHYYQPEVSELTLSKTSNAVQRNWTTPSEFPCCPQNFTGEPLQSYFDQLQEQLVFCQNEIYRSLVFKKVLANGNKSLHVLTENGEGVNSIKRWAVATITFEDNKFVHESLGAFFSVEGAEKVYCLAQGLEWTGGDSIDDYC